MKKYVRKSTRHFMFNSMHRLLMCVSILHEHCTLLHPLSILGYLILAILVSFARKKRRGKQDLHNMQPRKPKVSICTSLCLCTLLNPLSPNSDQHQFSPNDIGTLSRGKVMRINK